MKMKRPSRVTITWPPSSLRASPSSWSSCRRSVSNSPLCSLSRATSTRHSSRLRGGSSQSVTGGTLVWADPLDLDQAPGRAEVVDRRRADLALRPPGLVDVAADRHLRPLRLDRVQDRLAAEVAAVAALVAVPLRRGVDHEHGALGTAGEPLGGLILVEVEAPVPRRDRDPRAEAEEVGAVDL